MKNNGIFIRARELMRGVPLIDLHIHTRYSDGKSTVEEYVEEANLQGYKIICFTDHVDFTTNWFDVYSREIASSNSTCNGMRVMRGLEVRARDMDGRLNAPDEIINGAEMVIGVVHSIPAEDGKGKRNPAEFTPERLLEIEYSLSLSLLENEKVSVLGHPMSNYEKLHGPVPQYYYRDIIDKAIAMGKAVEISAKYKNDFKGFLDLCIELDPMVSLGSDAHSIQELGMVSAKLRREMG